MFLNHAFISQVRTKYRKDEKLQQMYGDGDNPIAKHNSTFRLKTKYIDEVMQQIIAASRA